MITQDGLSKYLSVSWTQLNVPGPSATQLTFSVCAEEHIAARTMVRMDMMPTSRMVAPWISGVMVYGTLVERDDWSPLQSYGFPQ
jgi:hypothetical protein